MLNLIRKILKRPRPKPYRITVIESGRADAPYGPEVAMVMNYQFFDATQIAPPKNLEPRFVVSRKPGYRPFPKIDGLTVCVDEVCDLGIITDRAHVLRQIMLALKAQSN